MPSFKTLEEQYKAYKEAVIEVTKESIPPIMKEVHKEAIEIEVYMRYEPSVYERRYGKEGSLSDESNFDIEFDIDKNRINVILYNEAKGNPEWPNNQSNKFIDKIIVEGSGYSWKGSKIAQLGLERDFYRVTEEIMASPTIRKKIINEFNKRGFNMW